MVEMPGMIVYWKIIFITTLISCCNWWRREMFHPPACRPFRYGYSDCSLVVVRVVLIFRKRRGHRKILGARRVA
jgi:hypothetical protein